MTNNERKVKYAAITVIVIFGAILMVSIADAGGFGALKVYIKNLRNVSGSAERDAIARETKEVPLYKPTLDYEDAVVSAVEKASPSVVSIAISKNVEQVENCTYDPFANMPDEFRSMIGNNMQFTRPCTTGTTKKQDVGGGSGFIVSGDGLILTNKHVVSDKTAEYTVFTNDGKKYPAKVLARSSTNDIALIKITATGLKTATLGDSDSIKLGQTAIVIGNALAEFRNTVSTGVISGLSRSVTASGSGYGSEKISGVIQTDAAINPGNSGGPLLNLRGEVIGMSTAMADGAENIGFAIPINQVKRAIESVQKTGSIKTPYLGVRYLLLNEDVAKKEKLSVTEGALVRGTDDGPAVIKKSPAAKAGIQAEDIIISVNAEKITTDKSLTDILQKYGIGDTITLMVRRGDTTMKLPLTLEERPSDL